MTERILCVLAAAAVPWAFAAAQSPDGGTVPCDSNCHMRSFFYSRYSNRCLYWQKSDCTFCVGSLSLCVPSTDPPTCKTTSPGIPNDYKWYGPACTQRCTGWTTKTYTEAFPFLPSGVLLDSGTVDQSVCDS